uniref:Uncharacterized protein n=1 Tax=Rhizophora mucronata TaxID=61149 RepID=A0A2P2QSJ2_RHIMU
MGKELLVNRLLVFDLEPPLQHG